MSGRSWICVLILGCTFGAIQPAQAGIIELTGSFSFSQNDLGSPSYEWTRRWSVSAGYYFWGLSEIEFAMQDVVYRTVILGLEDTTFHDQIYSIDWVQYLAPKHSYIVPFLKVGIGQLDREASGSYWAGGAPPQVDDSLSVVLGAGLKVVLSQTFAVRGEATTYLSGGVLSTWSNNFAVTFGFSLFVL